jgi:predicted phosphodiesterase
VIRKQLVDRVLRTGDLLTARLKTEKPDRLYVVGMGDMIEGCDGHYPMQTFQTGASGLNGRRDQVKLVRRLLVKLLTGWARHVPSMVVGAVPGNHGEGRKDGKAYTTFDDNDDIAVFEQTSEILAGNPESYQHVRFVVPDGDLALTLDVAGTAVGFVHGHQARRGSTPSVKLTGWWKDKAHAQHPIGDATILVSGHYHHLAVLQEGPKTWLQCPALDGGSRWWEESGGGRAPVGTLSFKVGPDGWSGLEVLR